MKDKCVLVPDLDNLIELIFKKVKFQMAANILFPYRIDNLYVKMNFDKIN